MTASTTGRLVQLRQERPRLYHPVGDDGYQFPPPTDPVRQRILANILASCEEMASKRPAECIPECPDSPHPFHQLYVTFYAGMEAGALIEQYSFAWRLTREERWLAKAREWLSAACRWEHSDRLEEHFYTANRYMQAFAVALDWLAGALTEAEEQQIVDCLVRMMERWWPDVNAGRRSDSGGHHAVVDNGHFGVAALQLLGRHPQAAEWVQAVVDRFRTGIMTNGCGEDGSPVDGPSFWGCENGWMLQFADACRSVVGIDLYDEFPERLTRPLLFVRYHLVPPAEIVPQTYPPVYATMLTGDHELTYSSPILLRLAQDAGDADLRAIALRDSMMGRIYRYGVGVKNSSSECITARGPYAYMYYDPHFGPRPRAAPLPLSRTFAARYGDSAVLRSSWKDQSLVALATGYGGGVAHGFSNLHVQWAGYPLLKPIGAFEASPVSCGNLPCVGGQNEHVALLRELVRDTDADAVLVESPRTRHEYRLLRGKTPALLVAVQRRPRGVRVVDNEGEAFARLDGRDYLQYPREPYFNADAGELRIRARLNAPVEGERHRILFHTGMSFPGRGTSVNGFFLGFPGEGKGLTFGVQNQRYLIVETEIPPEVAEVNPGEWHEIGARWGGFNTLEGHPFIEIELDGHARRLDDPDVFGELGRDTTGLERNVPRTFYVHPNTVLAFGAPVQIPDAGTAVDMAEIRLVCPERNPLLVDFSGGLTGETGSGELMVKLNPTELLELAETGALFGAGPGRVNVLPVLPGTVFRQEVVPYFTAGLAAGSRKSFIEGRESDSTRVLASCGNGDVLVLLFVPEAAAASARSTDDGFEVSLDGVGHRFALHTGGERILRRK